MSIPAQSLPSRTPPTSLGVVTDNNLCFPDTKSSLCPSKFPRRPLRPARPRRRVINHRVPRLEPADSAGESGGQDTTVKAPRSTDSTRPPLQVKVDARTRPTGHDRERRRRKGVKESHHPFHLAHITNEVRYRHTQKPNPTPGFHDLSWWPTTFDSLTASSEKGQKMKFSRCAKCFKAWSNCHFDCHVFWGCGGKQ